MFSQTASVRSNFFKAPCTRSGSKRMTRLIFTNGTNLLVRHSRSVLGLMPNSFANSNSRKNCFMVARLAVLQRYTPLNAFLFLNKTFKGDTSKLYGTPSKESESSSNTLAANSFNTESRDDKRGSREENGHTGGEY